MNIILLSYWDDRFSRNSFVINPSSPSLLAVPLESTKMLHRAYICKSSNDRLSLVFPYVRAHWRTSLLCLSLLIPPYLSVNNG